MYMRSALLLSKAPRGASVRVWGTSCVLEDTALFINYVICKNNELQASSISTSTFSLQTSSTCLLQSAIRQPAYLLTQESI